MEAKALPGGEGYSNDANALYVAGLPEDTTDLELYHIFGTFGPIPPKGVRAMMNEWGGCKGFGFVNFMDAQTLQTAAMTLNGATLPNGQPLIVKPKNKGEGKGGTGG